MAEAQVQSAETTEQEPFIIPHSQSKFRQQRVPACKPFLTPLFASIIFGIFAIISIAIAVPYWMASQELVEYSTEYKTGDTQIEIDVKKDIKGKIRMYYELSNYYQNNFLYSSSKSWNQLMGKSFKDSDNSKCAPVKEEDGKVYAPCGAVALSVFNDTFSPPFEIQTTGITQKNYKKVYKPIGSGYNTNNSNFWMDETIFPGGQTNEHFINWAQIAAFPTFRKLWAIIPLDELKAGKYQIGVNSIYDVESFGGKKRLVIANTNWIGGKNDFFGIFFFVMCGINFLAFVVFLILHLTNAMPLQRSIIREESVINESLTHTY